MIEFEDVSLVLSQRQVLENLSFRIESGQIVLLVGGSGTGKSSILRLILRLIPPTSGRIRVLGEVIDKLPEKRMNQLRQQIGLVFQEGALFDSLTVEENVGLFLIENLHLPMETVHQRVEGILESLGLSDYMNYYPSQLSGGMKKRVAIARAIVSKPQMLLYDEP
ncbi:MAG: ATP-binding cassette domain-containing protein, partial [Calditrichaeota bacterium]|nr:ATP-binding cassette domain-containing protein [Calditrichota bacterium]